MFYTIRMPINLKTLLFYRRSAIVSAAVLQMGAFALAREPIMSSTMKREKISSVPSVRSNRRRTTPQMSKLSHPSDYLTKIKAN
jgi:hypothetical protein